MRVGTKSNYTPRQIEGAVMEEGRRCLPLVSLAVQVGAVAAVGEELRRAISRMEEGR